MQETDLNVEQLQAVLTTLDKIEIEASETESRVLKTIRIQLQTAKKQIGKLMSDTSTKDIQAILDTYEEGEIEEYIASIIEGAWLADATKAKFIAEHEDIQQLRIFGDCIKKAVEASPFGLRKFKIKHLQPIRTKLAASKTIHELRQWCKTMAAQLEYYRTVSEELQDKADMIEWLTSETERMYKITEEAYRVTSTIVPYYDAGLNDIALLKNIENTKKANNLSDAEAAKLFGVSRTKLLALRKEIQLDALTPEQKDMLRKQPIPELTAMLLEDVAKSIQSFKKEEDLEYEKFLELHSDLGAVLPMDVLTPEQVDVRRNPPIPELTTKQQEASLGLDRNKNPN